MQSLHILLVTLLIICGFLVFISDNPVHSVLFLILTFCNAASILFLFNVDFLGVLFIIIYVGAIAVLFLFVVMMLNVKIQSFRNLSYVPVVFLGSVFLLIQIFLSLESVFFDLNFETKHQYFLFEKHLDNLVNIDVFGQALYNYYLICFLIAGLILLVAMTGAIVLTLTFRSHRKTELVFRQLSRSDKFLSFFK